MNISVSDAGGPEDCWSVDGHSGDANPFLHDLEPNNELDTASGVKLARTDAKEHGEVRAVSCSLSLELSNISNVLELCFGFAQIFAFFTTKATKDVACFFFAANLDKPARRFRKDPDDCEEKEKWDDLKSDRKAPNEGAVATLVEAAAVLEPVRHHYTKNIQGELNSDELPSRFVFGGFGSPDWNNGVKDTSTPAVDQTSKDHPDMVLC